jgi:hypothetical protein
VAGPAALAEALTTNSTSSRSGLPPALWKVKRWHDEQMVPRWCAAGMREVGHHAAVSTVACSCQDCAPWTYARSSHILLAPVTVGSEPVLMPNGRRQAADGYFKDQAHAAVRTVYTSPAYVKVGRGSPADNSRELCHLQLGSVVQGHRGKELHCSLVATTRVVRWLPQILGIYMGSEPRKLSYTAHRGLSDRPMSTVACNNTFVWRLCYATTPFRGFNLHVRS